MSNKILAFKVAYLLGVEENVLKRDYEEDYELSNNLKCFSDYENANKLRCLSRARNSVIRYNSLYEDGSDLRKITGQYLAKEISFLANEGIDLINLFSVNTQIDYLNTITQYIDGLKYQVLKVLGLPRAEVIQEFFYFPILDSRTFKNFLRELKTLSCPHGMIIFNGSKIKQSLSYSLLNNRNLYFSAYSIQSKRYDGLLDLENGYDWGTVISEFDSQILNKVKNNMKVETKGVMQKVYSNSIPLLDKGMLRFIEEGETEVFVDCDNSDFFKVVNFLRALEGYKTLKGIKLIVDLKSNFLWKVFKELYVGTIPVTIVQVKRIKENKSVADVVLTKEVCESFYTRGLRQAIVVSSDSDFFGLITSLPEISFCIAYTEGQMNDEYLKYLESNNITAYDLTELDSEEVLEYYKDVCIEYLLAYTLAQTPVSKWELLNICSIVEFHLSKETDLDIEESYIKDKVREFIENVKLEIRGTSTYITVNSITINASML